MSNRSSRPPRAPPPSSLFRVDSVCMLLNFFLSCHFPDLATVSFGQGVSATSLQVLNGFNTLANGGYLLQPRIISEVRSDDEKIDIPTKNLGRVISKETSKTMIDLLEQAVNLTEKPISVKPNAGQPRVEGINTYYDQPIQDFAQDIQKMINLGAKIVGGCCGTTPQTINVIRKIIDSI